MVIGYRMLLDTKELRHLLLSEPDGLAFKPHFELRHALLGILHKLALGGNWLLGSALHMLHLLSTAATLRADA
jgi:hypothetical protein